MNKKFSLFIIIVVLLLFSFFYFLKTKELSQNLKTTNNDEVINLGDCDNIKNDESKTKKCLADLIRSSVENKGMAYGMKLFVKLYENPVFAANCHDYSHIIGEAAYFDFKKNNKIDISPAMNYCYFGFFHGFMEPLFAKGDDIQVARDLCTYMDKQIDIPYHNTYGACLHAIGHGVVDGSNRKAWGNAQAIADPGLKICDQVAIGTEDAFRCYSGVYNSISLAILQKKYGLTENIDDPLEFCKKQKDKYKRACYSDAGATRILLFVSHDLRKAAKIFETIKEDEYAFTAMFDTVQLEADEYMKHKAYSFEEMVNICRSIQDRMRIACIKGWGSGLAEFGKPNEEHAQASLFCGNSLLTEEEKRSCFVNVFGFLRATKKPETFIEICGKIGKIAGDKWKDLCLQ
jgi:hypothetical protein